MVLLLSIWSFFSWRRVRTDIWSAFIIALILTAAAKRHVILMALALVRRNWVRMSLYFFEVVRILIRWIGGKVLVIIAHIFPINISMHWRWLFLIWFFVWRRVINIAVVIVATEFVVAPFVKKVAIWIQETTVVVHVKALFIILAIFESFILFFLIARLPTPSLIRPGFLRLSSNCSVLAIVNLSGHWSLSLLAVDASTAASSDTLVIPPSTVSVFSSSSRYSVSRLSWRQSIFMRGLCIVSGSLLLPAAFAGWILYFLFLPALCSCRCFGFW